MIMAHLPLTCLLCLCNTSTAVQQPQCLLHATASILPIQAVPPTGDLRGLLKAVVACLGAMHMHWPLKVLMESMRRPCCTMCYVHVEHAPREPATACNRQQAHTVLCCVLGSNCRSSAISDRWLAPTELGR